MLALTSCIHEVKRGQMSPIPAGKYAVVGEVVANGLYDYSADMTVLSAVKLAGGTTPTASTPHASITRYLSGMAVTVPVRLDNISRGIEPDVPLEEGDIVMVPSVAEFGRQPANVEPPAD